MPDRPVDQPDVNPAVVAGDPLLTKIADLIGSVDLHIGWKRRINLTTAQKELWADLVDADAVNSQESWTDEPRRHVRWWREQHPFFESRPSGPEDPRWWDETPEPDPFVYDEHRSPTPDGPVEASPNQAAVGVARAAMLDVFADPHHPDRAWVAEDFAAVYEWAKRAARPLRTAHDAVVPSHGVYPSLNQAREFLAAYRLARETRFAEDPVAEPEQDSSDDRERSD